MSVAAKYKVGDVIFFAKGLPPIIRKVTYKDGQGYRLEYYSELKTHSYWTQIESLDGYDFYYLVSRKLIR